MNLRCGLVSPPELPAAPELSLLQVQLAIGAATWTVSSGMHEAVVFGERAPALNSMRTKDADKICRSQVSHFATPPFGHPAKTKILDRDRIEAANQRQGCFMMPISPLVGYSFMHPCQGQPGLLPAFRPARLLRKTSG